MRRVLLHHKTRLRFLTKYEVGFDAPFESLPSLQKRQNLVKQYIGVTEDLPKFFEVVKIRCPWLHFLQVPASFSPMPKGTERMLDMLKGLIRGLLRDLKESPLRPSDPEGRLVHLAGVPGMVELSNLHSTLAHHHEKQQQQHQHKDSAGPSVFFDDDEDDSRLDSSWEC